MAKLLGKAPNQVPTNADLGTMAFQDREGINVNNAIVANLVVTGATSVNATFAVVNTTANVLFVAANGNIGIGNNTPANKLRVEGTASFLTSAAVGANVIANTTALFLGNSTVNTVITSGSLTIANTTNTLFVVAANGNIGINTSSPTTKLFLSSDAGPSRSIRYDTGNTPSFRIRYNDNGITAPFQLENWAMTAAGQGTSITATLSTDGSTAYSGGRISFVSEGDYTSAGNANSLIRFDTSSANNFIERMRIVANGNIGIGNTTPTNKLTVEGNTISLSANDASTKIELLNRGNNTTTRFPQFVATHYSGNTAAGDSGGQPVVELIHARGSLGAGLPVQVGDILGGFNTWGSNSTAILSATRIQGVVESAFTTTATAAIQFITTNAGTAAEVVRFSANGNVGIGNATPGSKLTIAGATPGPITIGAWAAGYNAINLNGNNVGGAGGSDYNILGDASSLFINRASGSMYFRLNNNDQMFLSSSGNFGIGNTAPAEKLVVNGTANISGNVTMSSWLGIGFAAFSTGTTLSVNKNITGTTTALGVYNYGTVQSDVTNTYYGFRNNLATAASATPWTLGAYYHYFANETTVGANNTVTSEYGYAVSSNFGSSANVTNAYGFRGSVVAGANRWNLYMDGTANNYLGGDLTVAGNLTVSGTTTYINTTTLNIGDNIITLNADVTGATAPSENAGIEINRGSAANSFFIWNETTDTWFANGGGFVVANTSANTLYVAANGNIGIGNSVPTDTLVIENNAANNIVRIRSTNSAVLFIEADSDNVDENHHAQIILSQDGGVVRGRFGYFGGGNGLLIYNEFEGNLTLGSNNVGVMTIAANGNIGIGNTAPAHALRIESGVLSLGNSTSNVQISIPTSVIASATNYWLNANGQWSIISGVAAVAGGSNTHIQYNNSGAVDGSAALTFNNTTNNVFIANTLLFGNSTVNTTISSTSASIAANSTYTGITVAANGNVGVGHAAPTSRLLVNGAFRSVLSGQGDYVISHSGLVSTAGAVAGVQLALTGGGTEAIRIDLGANVGIGNTAPAQKLQVTGTVQFSNSTASVLLAAANGNIGIGNTAPTDKLVVGGNIFANNLRRYTATRTLTTTANDTVEIGTMYSDAGAHSLDITIQVTDAAFSVTKRYLINSPWNATGGATYRKVVPAFDSGPFSSNDYDLEAYHNNQTLGLRVRRTAGGVTGTLEIMIDDKVLQSESTLDSFTPSSTTASGVAAVTDIFPGARLTQTGVSAAVSNSFIVVANTTVNAITANNTNVTFGVPVTISSSAFLTIGGAVLSYFGLTTSATTANQVLHSTNASSWRVAKYLIKINSGAAYQATEILLIHDGTTVYKTEYAQVFTGAVLATFDADINSGNLRLLTTPTNAVTAYAGTVELLPV